jgi:hypothetical protein
VLSYNPERALFLAVIFLILGLRRGHSLGLTRRVCRDLAWVIRTRREQGECEIEVSKAK